MISSIGYEVLLPVECDVIMRSIDVLIYFTDSDTYVYENAPLLKYSSRTVIVRVFSAAS